MSWMGFQGCWVFTNFKSSLQHDLKRRSSYTHVNLITLRAKLKELYKNRMLKIPKIIIVTFSWDKCKTVPTIEKYWWRHVFNSAWTAMTLNVVMHYVISPILSQNYIPLSWKLCTTHNTRKLDAKYSWKPNEKWNTLRDLPKVITILCGSEDFYDIWISACQHIVPCIYMCQFTTPRSTLLWPMEQLDPSPRASTDSSI